MTRAPHAEAGRGVGAGRSSRGRHTGRFVWYSQAKGVVHDALGDAKR